MNDRELLTSTADKVRALIEDGNIVSDDLDVCVLVIKRENNKVAFTSSLLDPAALHEVLLSTAVQLMRSKR